MASAWLLGSLHGFCSCLTSLLKFEKVNKAYGDDGDLVDVLFLDFQNASDRVFHWSVAAMG